MTARASVLLISDLAYPARGRRYCDEDIALSTRLRERFDVALAHPADAVALMDGFDLVLVRNSGPALGYWDDYQAFRAHAQATGAKVYNELTGRADMLGKQYLLDLHRDGFPVIPSVATGSELDHLPTADAYVVKPLFGADSAGLRILDAAGVRAITDDDVLIQPRVDIAHEISFTFIDHDFQYALYAPDPERRWELAPYEPSADDLAFAQRFIEWNAIDHGIQRVDACRTADGRLLLVELEDLNPFLSLDALEHERREAFVARLVDALNGLLRS